MDIQSNNFRLFISYEFKQLNNETFKNKIINHIIVYIHHDDY